MNNFVSPPNGRAGEETGLVTLVRALQDKLQLASKITRDWQVEFEVTVELETFDIKVSAIKPNGGGGFIKTIPRQEVLYYINDPDTLINLIADLVFDNLLRGIIKNELSEKMHRAMTNVRVLNGKQK